MAKPKTKEELIRASQGNFKKLNDLIDSYSEQERHAEFPPGTLNRNIRDVLAHLHHWHLLLLDWYEVGMRGDKPEMPAKGYRWKETPPLNRRIQEMYTDVPFDDARNMLRKSYRQIQQIIARHSDAELFEKRKYTWTGSTSLGAYITANTSSHYAWAIRLIRRATTQW